MREAWDKDAIWDAVRAFLRDNPESLIKDIAQGAEGLQGQGNALVTRIYTVLMEHLAAGEVERGRGEGPAYRYSLRDPAEAHVIKMVLSTEEHRKLLRIARRIRAQPDEAVRTLTLAGIQYLEAIR